MKNEKGYALVTVLLTVVLIVTVSSVLMSSVLSSRKLVNISEEEMQAIDLAEMGVKHFTSELEDILSEINSTPEKYPNKNNIDETIIEQLNNKFSNEFTVNNNEKYKYKVKDINKSRENNNINFTFTSTGEVNNGTRLQKKDITGNLSILVHPANSDENIFDDPKLKDKLCKTGEKESYEITYDNKVYTVYPSGFTVDKTTIDGNIITCGLDIQLKNNESGNGNNGKGNSGKGNNGNGNDESKHITFNGDLISLGNFNIFIQKNHYSVTINGNANLDYLSTINQGGKLTVNGNAKFENLTIHQSGKLTIGGNAIFNSLELKNSASVEITKNTTIFNELILKNKSSFYVSKNACINKISGKMDGLNVLGTLSNSCETPPTSNDSFRLVLLNDLTVEYK